MYICIYGNVRLIDDPPQMSKKLCFGTRTRSHLGITRKTRFVSDTQKTIAAAWANYGVSSPIFLPPLTDPKKQQKEYKLPYKRKIRGYRQMATNGLSDPLQSSWRLRFRALFAPGFAFLCLFIFLGPAGPVFFPPQ